MRPSAFWPITISLALAACTTPSEFDGGPRDAGRTDDSTAPLVPDASAPSDSGLDALSPPDVGTHVEDAGLSDDAASIDVGSDARMPVDGGTDAAITDAPVTPDAYDPCAPDDYEPNDVAAGAPVVFEIGAPVAPSSPFDVYEMTWHSGDAADWISGTVAATGPVVRVTGIADEYSTAPSLPALVTISIRCRSGLSYCRGVSGQTRLGQLCTSDPRAGISYLDAGCEDPSMGVEVRVGVTPRRAPDAPRCDHEIRARVSVPE